MRSGVRWLGACLIVLCVSCVSALIGRADAEDWGAYALIPASAPEMTLEAIGAGTQDGTIVSIGKPSGLPTQKWFIIPRGKDFFVIKPASSSTLVLATAKGGTQNGTPIVLETDKGSPWQEWALHKSETGTYRLTPRHAPDKGLDDFGGNRNPGAKQDLWTNTPGDMHLQWIIKPLAGTPGALANSNMGTATPYTAPDIASEKVLKGEVKHTSFSHSTIFPGTVRPVSVFIPAQYDGSKPACVYVKTDGYNPAEKPLLETLIATGEMPVTIAVFVGPGDVPAPMKNTLGRRNRGLEYDGMGDKNVRFLVEELLPFVAKEFGLKLSDKGNDRCIAGGSSGGIAAFNAAWERPEAFSRVYANSGSFVAFRGGHEFPTLVRKFEAKPIRAYLTTGTSDMENAAGDWFLLDQEMDKSLRFSGYDYTFRIINGGHVAGYYENFQEAMSFLWKGWPQPVRPGPSAPRVRDVILPGEAWQEQKITGSTSGPHHFQAAACNASGEVFFTDTATNKVYRLGLDGNVQEFLHDGGQANGLTVGPQGQLYTVSRQTGKIMRYDTSGKGSLVVDGMRGDYILATPSGGFYVTVNADKARNGGEVWFVKDGKQIRVASELKQATGMAYRPDQWLLSVAEGDSKWVNSYQMNPDGTLTNRERYFWLHVPDWEDDAGAAAVAYAKEGQMLVATRFGIQISADDGPTQVILPLPDRSRVLGLCLGGREMDTLFAFCGEKIWKRKVKIHAIGAFTPWTSVNASPL